MRSAKRALVVVSLSLLAAASEGQERRLAAGALEQIRALDQEKQARTPAQRKLDSRLLYALYRQRGDARLDAVPSLRVVSPEKDGRILVDVDLVSAGGLKPVLARLRGMGADVVSHSARFRSIRARMPLLQAESLAAMKEVRRVELARRALLEKVNTSEGDAAHRAAAARSFFGVSGAGLKVCVLSDGVDSLASVQASGDLPAVDVLAGQAGSGDEGTAMLEIVHDLAPGAALGFATAFTSEASFAQNILDLRNLRGCDILVDDVIYLDESPFQDGVLAQAVNTVTAGGALYFSSAGNEGNVDNLTSATWEGDFHPNGTLAGVPGTAHDFGDGGQSLTNLGFADAPYVLHWAEPFGAAGHDYDLFILDSTLTSVVDSSTNNQDGNDDPFEATSFGPFPSDEVVVVKRSGTNPMPMFNLFAARSQFDTALATSGATRGHSAAANAMSVAAVDAASAGGAGGAFDGSELVESFSSDGPRRIFFNNAGALLPGAPAGNFTASGGVVRQKPDVAAADGVSTAAPGFDPFFGTSAAAPHAAAVAALVKQAFPGFTAAQVRAALKGSALDIEAAGVDRDSGSGIVMAYETLSDNGAAAAANLAIGTVTPAPLSGDGDGFVEPGESFNLTVALANVGGAGASAISATLSSATSGVTVTAASSAYPAIAISGSAPNTTPFAFSVSSSLACATALQFTLTVSYAGGVTSPVALTFSLDTGQPGTPLTFAYAGPVVPIPDGILPEVPGETVSIPVAVSALGGKVRDVNVKIRGSACTTAIGATTVGIDHSFVEDLVLELQAPGGQTTTLFSRTGEDGHNFCQTLLDDESGGPPIQAQLFSDAPFTGSFTPAAPLASFRGINGNGTWHLLATDFFEGDSGNVRAFSLIVTPTVCDAAPPVTIAIDDASVGEGNSGTVNATFHVSLSAASAQTVTVKYATAAGTAAAGVDYVTKALTTLTFTPGQVSKTVTVAVKGDAKDEADETFFVNLSAPTNAAIADHQGLGTIVDDDPLPVLSISDVSVVEGNAGTKSATFTVTLTPASGRSVSVKYATAPGSATAGTDYTSVASTTLSFAAGETSKTLSVSVKGDRDEEPDETFFVDLSAPAKATIGDGHGVGTIQNNDGPPDVSIADVTIVEGNTGTKNLLLTVMLSGATFNSVSVGYQTADRGSAPGDASAGLDYVAKGGTLNFTPGQKSKTITLQVNGDVLVEGSESFFVNLTGATSANLLDAQALATITDDD